MKPCVMLIIDGLGDLPVSSLGGRTPLEAAYTPNFDRLASAGHFGLVDPIKPGVIPNTDSGTGLLMGMLPAEVDKLRRGTIEAAGIGRILQPGEVALRANFASADPDGEAPLIVDRRAGRMDYGLDRLAEELSGMVLGGEVCAEFISTEQHRGVLVLSGEALTHEISDTDPGDAQLPTPLLWSQPLSPAARLCADSLNQFIRNASKVLQDHPVNQERKAQKLKPANVIITRGAGRAIDVGNQVSQRDISAAVVSGCNTVRGLGRLLGFHLFDDPSFTAGLDTNLEGKFGAALEALEHHPLVFVQIKAADICAHDLNPGAKRDFIQRIDQAILPLIESNAVLAIAADHTTNSNSGHHTGDPVPALLCGHRTQVAGDASDLAINFGESACRQGNMGRQNSEAFLRRTLDFMM